MLLLLQGRGKGLCCKAHTYVHLCRCPFCLTEVYLILYLSLCKVEDHCEVFCLFLFHPLKNACIKTNQPKPLNSSHFPLQSVLASTRLAKVPLQPSNTVKFPFPVSKHVTCRVLLKSDFSSTLRRQSRVFSCLHNDKWFRLLGRKLLSGTNKLLRNKIKITRD